MKKILFAMATFFGCAISSVAQTNFIATLQHADEFTHYYGAGALQSAYNAAETGDIITLSPGTFTFSGGFDKAITLRGAGVESVDKTYVSSEITFISRDGTKITTVEGIKFSGRTYIQNSSDEGQGTIKFIKNTFNEILATKAGSSTVKGPAVRFYNCAIYANLFFNSQTFPDFLLYNCYVENPYSDNSSETTTALVNCVILWSKKDRVRYAKYLNFYNCIFNTNSYYGDSDYDILPNTVTCYNCLSINKSKLFNNLVSGGNNQTVSSASDVFKTYRTNQNESETFELTDAAKAAYIGTDGKEIGMQGGNYPYTTTVQYPVITTFNSDSQTTKEGILSVEVKVDGK